MSLLVLRLFGRLHFFRLSARMGLDGLIGAFLHREGMVGYDRLSWLHSGSSRLGLFLLKSAKKPARGALPSGTFCSFKRASDTSTIDCVSTPSGQWLCGTMDSYSELTD